MRRRRRKPRARPTDLRSSFGRRFYVPLVDRPTRILPSQGRRKKASLCNATCAWERSRGGRTPESRRRAGGGVMIHFKTEKEGAEHRPAGRGLNRKICEATESSVPKTESSLERESTVMCSTKNKRANERSLGRPAFRRAFFTLSLRTLPARYSGT